MSFNTVNHHPLIKSEDNYVLSRQIVSIHSVDRDISQWPHSNTFAIQLPEAALNVQTMRLSMINLPSQLYNISNEYQNTKFTFSLGPSTGLLTITIPDGYYTPEMLINTLQTLMNEQIINYTVSGTSVVSFNVPSQQIDFVYTGSGETFTILAGLQEKYDFKKQCERGTYYHQYANWGAGFNLGFDKINSAVYTKYLDSYPEKLCSPDAVTLTALSTYHPSTTTKSLTYPWLPPSQSQLIATGQWIRAPNPVKLSGDQVVYMEVEKYNNLDEIYPYTDTGLCAPPQSAPNAPKPISGHVKSAFAKIPMSEAAANTATPNDFAGRTYFNPPAERINRLKFTFRTHDGRLIDFQDCPFNFSIELYSLLPEQLRKMNITIPEVYRI